MKKESMYITPPPPIHNFQLKILALHITISLSILYAFIVLFINLKSTSNFTLIILAASITHFTLVNYKLNELPITNYQLLII